MIFSIHLNSFYTITGIKIAIMAAQRNEIYSQSAGYCPGNAEGHY